MRERRRAGFGCSCPLIPCPVTETFALGKAACPLGPGAAPSFPEQGNAVQPQAQTRPQGRGNAVPGGMADTQLLASPQQINVAIM